MRRDNAQKGSRTRKQEIVQKWVNKASKKEGKADKKMAKQTRRKKEQNRKQANKPVQWRVKNFFEAAENRKTHVF